VVAGAAERRPMTTAALLGSSTPWQDDGDNTNARGEEAQASRDVGGRGGSCCEPRDK
jgi:hypothetical protein